jgi:autotransporter passenger strand-loop-strand repeat protein
MHTSTTGQSRLAVSLLDPVSGFRFRPIAAVVIAALPLLTYPAHAADSVVGSGQVVNNLTVNGPDTQTVVDGGQTSSTNVSSGGTQAVSSGGSALNTLVNSSGAQVDL